MQHGKILQNHACNCSIGSPEDAHNLSFLTGSIRAKFHIAAICTGGCYPSVFTVKSA